MNTLPLSDEATSGYFLHETFKLMTLSFSRMISLSLPNGHSLECYKSTLEGMGSSVLLR